MIDLDELKNKYIENAGTNAGNLTSDEVFELIDRLQAAESTQEIINMLLADISVDKNASIMDKLEALKRHWYFIARDAAAEEIEKLKAENQELRMQYVSDFGQEQENNPIYQYRGAPGFWVDCDLKLYNLMEGKHRRIVYLHPAQSNSEIPKTYHAAAVRVCPDRDIEIRSGYPAPSLKDINIREMKEFIHRFKNSMIGDQDV